MDEIFDEIFAKDAISHDPSQPNLGRGPGGARESMEVYTTASPDTKIVIEREIAEGATTWCSICARAARTAVRSPTSPPPARRQNVTGVIISKLQDGKVVETWSLWD